MRTTYPQNSKEDLNLFMGVDPGKSGCIVLIHGTGEWAAELSLESTLTDIGTMLRMYRRSITFALIEQVHSGIFGSQGKMGVRSSFTFGDSFGSIRGMVTVCNIRHEYIQPQKWQQEMNCRTHGDKNVSKAKAQQLFPSVKVTHRNADALLIAELARRKAIERGLK